MTLTTLLGSGAYAVINGSWMQALLTLALCLVSEMSIPLQRRSFAVDISAFSAIFQPSSTIICLAIFTIWLLWDLGHTGGADMKLMIATTLTFGSPAILIPVTILSGFQGAVALLRMQTYVPSVLSIFLGTLLNTLDPLRKIGRRCFSTSDSITERIIRRSSPQMTAFSGAEEDWRACQESSFRAFSRRWRVLLRRSVSRQILTAIFAS